MTSTRVELAVLVSPEELETLEIVVDENLMGSPLKAVEDEPVWGVVEYEAVFR